MVVPHRGGDSSFSLRIPIKIIKAAAVALVCLLAGGLASFAHYQSTLQEAKAEQQELAYLRANREQQEQKLVQLAKATADVQQEMDKLTQLEGDVRRALNAEDITETSRSGIRRTNDDRTVDGGKGGPSMATVRSRR